MTIQGRSPHGPDDGVRVVTIASGRRTYWLIGIAIAVPIVATLAAVGMIRRSASTEAAAAPRAPLRADVVARADEPRRDAPAAPAPSPTAAHVVPRRMVVAPVADAPQGLGASPLPQPEKPRREIDAADVIVALREEGIHEGIAAFGIPGSHPPKSGILVPEEFSLPEGYVRHYQSTDDGQQLPAILMFHPDYEFVNDQGEVVPLPEDRVVTPPLAPPGMAIDMLEVPARKGGEPIR